MAASGGWRLTARADGAQRIVLPDQAMNAFLDCSGAFTFMNVEPGTTNTIMFGLLGCGREAAASERSEPHARSAGPTRLKTTRHRTYT